VMLFSTQKSIACIFFASRYSWRHERILPTQADSLRLLHRRWSRRNIISLQSNKITIPKKPNEINGFSHAKICGRRVRMGQAPLTSYMYMTPTQNWEIELVYQWRRVHRGGPLRGFLGKIKASKGFTP